MRTKKEINVRNRVKPLVILFVSNLLILTVILTVLFLPRPLLIDFLFYEEEPIKADVIILLSGASGRMETAAELYHQGYADKVLLTNAKAVGSTVERADKFGIPRAAVLKENQATSTYENALYSRDIVLEHGFRSALVVTSNFHMRRTRLAYERIFRGTDVTFTYVPYHHSTITRDSWDANEKMFKREYRKLIGGYFVYFEGVMNFYKEHVFDRVCEYPEVMELFDDCS
ncbi:YdcF family protein [Bacillus solitudinis]|uniref:YdcF family protein n=1 Tax=Bacillus solitudinis TaxID=2014074 RepID=UPI0012FD6AF9|nr:YdcF family protein [Bacillus solitudinis]